MSKSRTYLFIFFFFCFAFFLRFYPMPLGKTIFFGDTFSYYVPGKLFTAQALRHGTLPTWNPYLLGGISWIGDLNQSLFYFTSILFTLLEPVQALNWTIALHMAIGFLGAFFLGKRFTHRAYGGLVAGIVWMFSGIITGTMGNPSILQTLVWIPWISVAVSLENTKKGFVLAVFSLCMAIIGGYPQLLPYGMLFALTFDLMILKRTIKESLIWWFGVVTLALLATSFVTLPFSESIRSSTRVLQTATQATEGSLHPVDLLSIILPNIFIQEKLGIKWGPQWNAMNHVVLYVPWILLVTFWSNRTHLLKRKEIKFLLLWSGVGLVLSLGSRISFLSTVFTMIPLLRFARGPAHALSLLTLTMPLLSSALLTLPTPILTLREEVQLRVRIVVVVLCVAIFVAISQFTLIWQSANSILGGLLARSAFHTLAKDQLIFQNIGSTIIFHSLCFIALCYFLSRKKMIAFLILFAIELQMATSASLFFAPKSIYPTWNEIETKRAEYQPMVGEQQVFFTNGNAPYSDFASYMDALVVRKPFSDSFINQAELQSFTHLRSMRETLTPNWGMVYGVHTFNGYVSLMPQSVDVDFRGGRLEPLLNSLPMVSTTSATLSKWNVRFIVTDPWYPNSPSFDEVDLVGNFGRASVYSFKKTR